MGRRRSKDALFDVSLSIAGFMKLIGHSPLQWDANDPLGDVQESVLRTMLQLEESLDRHRHSDAWSSSTAGIIARKVDGRTEWHINVSLLSGR